MYLFGILFPMETQILKKKYISFISAYTLSSIPTDSNRQTYNQIETIAPQRSNWNYRTRMRFSHTYSPEKAGKSKADKPKTYEKTHSIKFRLSIKKAAVQKAAFVFPQS